MAEKARILEAMTREDFIAVTGARPEQDDLERANCPEAGQIGHWACGLCAHGRPLFLCPVCLQREVNARQSAILENLKENGTSPPSGHRA